MPKSALPKHLQDKKHNDWPWPLSYLPRSINVKGPRCGKGNPGYLAWPPKLIEGENVTRWETAGANSIIEIPAFMGKINSGIYGQKVDVLEKNEGNPEYGEWKRITIDWKEQEFITPGLISHPTQYHPSAIQKFTARGYMKLNPSFYAKWDRDDFFFRWGWRPDSLDVYYNWGPFLGMNFE